MCSLLDFPRIPESPTGANSKMAAASLSSQTCSCRVLQTCARQGRCSEATSVAMVTAVRVTQAGLEGNCKRRLGCFSHSGLLWRRPRMMVLIFSSDCSYV